ncbi:hypothetical protein CRG98_018403 [Punica granatum]|uniref:Uncharacterized protein n=1 Tax=Punica granatum TaxID=22663 RepID=A0A2I0JY37_PUNGR|nr:hypothetical protein CRG98_018403 [Punica granatum]
MRSIAGLLIAGLALAAVGIAWAFRSSGDRKTMKAPGRSHRIYRGCIDLGFTGNPFTWRNKRVGLASVKQRLDRAIANNEWRTTFPRAGVFHLPQIRFDHNPILLKLWIESSSKPRPFRSEEAWTRDQSSKIVVWSAWNRAVIGSTAFQLSSKIRMVKKDLRKWNKEELGYCDTNIAGIMEKLEQIQEKQPTPETKEQEERLVADLEENLLRKDLIWSQKLRELWLKDGDRNSKFFHLSTVIRRRSNHIAAIKDDNGEWIQDHDGIGNYFLRNFQYLFTTSHPSIPDDLEDLIGSTITESENERLIQIPDDKEILTALTSIPNLKAPSPDGIPSLFYKHYRETVKPLLL